MNSQQPSSLLSSMLSKKGHNSAAVTVIADAFNCISRPNLWALSARFSLNLAACRSVSEEQPSFKDTTKTNRTPQRLSMKTGEQLPSRGCTALSHKSLRFYRLGNECLLMVSESDRQQTGQHVWLPVIMQMF